MVKATKSKYKNSKIPSELFTDISKRSNSLPVETCKEVYFGLLKVIVDEFRAGRDVFLPELGRFALTKMKSQGRYDFKTGGLIPNNRYRRMDFTACEGLKKYINTMTVKTNDIME